MEEVEGLMTKLSGYVTLKSFEQLKGIVANKCEWIQYDELRLRTEGIDHRVKDQAVDIERADEKAVLLEGLLKKAGADIAATDRRLSGHIKAWTEGKAIQTEMTQRV